MFWATSIRQDSYKKSGFSQIYDDVLCPHSGLVTIIVKKPEETRFLSHDKLVALFCYYTSRAKYY